MSTCPLPAITTARLKWPQAPDEMRRLAAAAGLDTGCSHLLRFFDRAGVQDLRARRLAR